MTQRQVSSLCPHVTDTNLQLPQEVESGRGLHLLSVEVESEDEDRDDHRGHDLQRNLHVHHAAGEQHTSTSGWTVLTLSTRVI